MTPWRLASPVAGVALLVVLCGGVRAEELHPLAAQVKESLKDPAKPFTMLVRLRVKADATDKFEAAFAPAIKATRQEKGNIAYDLSRDIKQSSQYLVYERWKSLEALDAHLKAPHLTTLLGALGELLDGEPAVEVLLPAER